MFFLLPLAVWANGQKESTSSNAQATIRVMWWGDQKRADITNQMLKLFEKKNPSIKIEADFTPFSGFFDKLNTQLASGTAPDIFTLGSNILDYANKGVLLNLNPYVGNELKTTGIAKTLIDFNTINGKLDGMSVGANSRAILVNATMFQKAGVALPSKNWNWSDFGKIANEIHQKLGSGYWGTYDYSGMYDTLVYYMAQRGHGHFTKTSIDMPAPDLTQWFTMWQNLRKSGGAVPPDVQASSGPPASVNKSEVVTGKVAMVYMPTNQLGAYQNLTQDKLVLLPPPVGPNGQVTIDVESSQNIVGYTKTKYPKAVAQVMNFWVNNPEAAKILGNNRGVPVSPTALKAVEATASPTDNVIYKYLDYVSAHTTAKPIYNMPGFTHWNQLLISTSQAIAFGKISIADAVKRLITQGDQILVSAQ